MLHTLKQVPRRLLIGLVRVYQMVIGPHLPASCRYTPTCSKYAIQALQQYGAVKGTILAVWRVLRCNPWGGHGYDPPRWFTEPPQGGREDGSVGVWEEKTPRTKHQERSPTNQKSSA